MYILQKPALALDSGGVAAELAGWLVICFGIDWLYLVRSTEIHIGRRFGVLRNWFLLYEQALLAVPYWMSGWIMK